jgi:hypothetical protein
VLIKQKIPIVIIEMIIAAIRHGLNKFTFLSEIKNNTIRHRGVVKKEIVSCLIYEYSFKNILIVAINRKK